MSLFENRELVIATKHQKENVIAPLLEQKLGVCCMTNHFVDTDLLGTFTGEIERTLTPLEAMRSKCTLAMKTSNTSLAVASEGSFGPHPMIPFSIVGEEYMMLMDLKNNLEIVVKDISPETNFSGKEIKTETALLQWIDTVGFPSHGIVLRKNKNEATDIHKGITEKNSLLETFRLLQNSYGTVWAETDMRAMFNPTRMKRIGLLTEKLIDDIQSTCPKCAMPGFVITAVEPGLPCSWCGAKTKSIKRHIYACKHCDYSQHIENPLGKINEDPMYCDYCNP